jgi:hypothetical protein
VDVRPRLSRDPVALTSPQQDEAVIRVGHHVLALPFHEDPVLLVLPDDQRLLAALVLKQVVQLFIVNLEEGAVDREITRIKPALTAQKGGKDVLYAPGDDSVL